MSTVQCAGFLTVFICSCHISSFEIPVWGKGEGGRSLKQASNKQTAHFFTMREAAVIDLSQGRRLFVAYTKHILLFLQRIVLKCTIYFQYCQSDLHTPLNLANLMSNVTTHFNSLQTISQFSLNFQNAFLNFRYTQQHSRKLSFWLQN